jgi:hypothetical protein
MTRGRRRSLLRDSGGSVRIRDEAHIRRVREAKAAAVSSP